MYDRHISTALHYGKLWVDNPCSTSREVRGLAITAVVMQKCCENQGINGISMVYQWYINGISMYINDIIYGISMVYLYHCYFKQMFG